MKERNYKQKMALLPRCLINLGLMMQFYFPCSVYLSTICLIGHFAVTSPPTTGSTWAFLVPALFLIQLFPLFTSIALYAIYFLGDRYGNRRNALYFLIATNVVGGGIWLLYWIRFFIPAIWDHPAARFVAPLPVLIPLLFYMIVLFFINCGKT